MIQNSLVETCLMKTSLSGSVDDTKKILIYDNAIAASSSDRVATATNNCKEEFLYSMISLKNIKFSSEFYIIYNTNSLRYARKSANEFCGI